MVQTILVIEDEKDLALIVQAQLGAAGYKTILALDGAIAFANF
ncbi:MAG: hypothetical protein NT099_05340 [Candidatus Saganbacteria bacterium]|nr:hypothetical protein [Candidatus Saganbacteria bacterium]